jgi:hypothetical protein
MLSSAAHSVFDFRQRLAPIGQQQCSRPPRAICRTRVLILIKKGSANYAECWTFNGEDHGFRANPQNAGDAVKSAGVH